MARVALLLLFAATAQAEDAPSEPPVSTSPDGAAVELSLHEATPDSAAVMPRALTRAAAKERVESMSPVAWLGRFGQVEVGRRP